MHDFDILARQLAPHYSRFNVSERLLFSGHSHQAWPDVAIEGQIEAFDAAAQSVDQKWSLAFEKADVLREYLRDWYDDPNGLYCLAENTHILLVSWLSALNLKARPKIITTDGEFYTMHRQLKRLQEEGVEIERLAVEPFDTFAERLAAVADDRTAAIMLSRVYFQTGLINPHLKKVAKMGCDLNIPVLIDDYHGTNAVPLSLRDEGLEECYLVTGGYKYLQWGEGNCFLRFPKSCELRPVITGWFASFYTCDKPFVDGSISYDIAEQRFCSATYDPVSQFRAAKVVRFFHNQKLSKSLIRQQYMDQLECLKAYFLSAGFNPDQIRLKHSQPLENNGGFLALQSPYAAQLCRALFENGVLVDSRGDILRFGVAPYITALQIDKAMSILKMCVEKL